MKYLIYATGEIILVVIGILIAIQINDWNNDRLENEQGLKIYRNIRDQIIDDANELNKVKDFNGFYLGQYVYANELISRGDRTEIDTLAVMAMGLSQYSNFDRNANIYETLVNSGELKLVKNSEVTRRLQKLEMTYNRINKLEDIHWEIIINELSPELKGVIRYADMSIVKPQVLYSVELQNIFIESIFLNKGKEQVYEQALADIDSLVLVIDSELQQ
jgi:hypothetical protein